MANRSVTLWLYCKTPAGWRYCRPITGRNNKVKPQYALVNDHEEHHPDAFYYVRWREGTKTKWEKHVALSTALRQIEIKESYLRAKANGVAVQDEPRAPLPVMVSHTLDGYLDEYQLANRPESYSLMKQTLEEFTKFNRRNIVSQITRFDLLKYRQWLIDRGRSERTASNKMLRVCQYIRHVLKLDPGKGPVTVKDGKFVEREPEVYTDEDLQKFFAVIDNPFHTAVFKCLLMSGLRKAELENLTWDDVNFHSGTLKVQPKPGFSPKTWEERVIEVPEELLSIIRTLPRTSQYVFANERGNRWTHVWDVCNSIAKKAKVSGFHPHGFRRTYATRLLSHGIDLKTVQKLCGWRTLESAMRYLARAQSKAVKAKVDAIWAGK